ncbi:MAG: FAD-binding oxidoreductase [Prochlorotrichaceae cyanobacterium]
MSSLADFLNTLHSSENALEIIDDPSQVAKLSQDYYHFSPILQNQLVDRYGEIVLRPRTEADILQVAAACVQHRMPLTVRGAGTGNYGQCIPLEGGVILDLSLMTQVLAVEPGRVKVEPGAKLAAIDKVTREQGWELRMVPSTYRTATIAGFVAGGSGGIGSINYGFLSDRGNIEALRVVTLEDPPQVITLRGDEVHKATHAYGTTGIITALEMPLAPAYDWAEVVVGFAEFATATHFCQTLAESDGLVKKLICLCAWPIPTYFAALQNWIQAGETIVLLLIAEPSLDSFQTLVSETGGQVRYQKTTQDGGKGVNLLEYSWNHTTLHARSVDPQITYLQTLFPRDRSLEVLQEFYQHFGDEVMIHAEWIRSQGQPAIAGLQLVRYSTPERLQEIMDYHDRHGAIIFNPHTYFLEEGGRKTVDPVQLAFKEKADPYGLLNPGKMKAFRTPAAAKG